MVLRVPAGASSSGLAIRVMCAPERKARMLVLADTARIDLHQGNGGTFAQARRTNNA
ncbi:protein of unknown function [Pseudomonas sp. JV551A1]|uniref:Uncharacterized protein n=1 Tax=Pseudomonas inefficax TaxID=2078786 RepID=A0AAQ1P6C2_9PSED|nr:protein of unknown function [Pseudomonas sp. JV551A1]SPO59999.1 protein of unknown function [Pseudomonas inefficax]